MYRLPLFDTRVLDLADGLNAWAGRLLGDMGAEVIKVEPPAGDSLRGTPEFERLNANKYGCTLDAGTDEGRDALHRLAEVSDVLIVTGEPPAGLAAVNPGLITVTLDRVAGVTGGVAAAGAVGLALWDRRRSGRGSQITVAASGPPLTGRGGEPNVEPVSALGGELMLESPAWRLSETPLHIRLPAPALGEHNAYVFGRLLGLPDR